MSELIKMMPFNFLAQHYAGERIRAQLVNEKYQLQGNDFFLCGLEGKPYEFATRTNAEYWLESNLIRTAQKLETDTEAIERLNKKKQQLQDKNNIDAYWITEEVGQIELRNLQANGQASGVWHTWDDLWIDGGSA